MSRKRKKFGWFLFLIILVCIACFGAFRRQYAGVIRELAYTQVKNTTSDLCNEAIARQMEEGTIAYDRIVYFEKDLDGQITALKTNIAEINRLKADLLSIINREMLALEQTDLSIPFGSFFLPEFLAGKGPAIPVRILSIRNSEADFYSEFSQAGINQTLHQVTMVVSVDVSVLVLGKAESFTVTSQVIVAQTVIVGEVPDTFLQTGGNYGPETENP